MDIRGSGYLEFITDIRTQSLIKLHLNAFRYTGGIPSEILYDNLKQVVLERRIKAKESTFNSDFMMFSDHYGFTTRLCYPNRPQTKGYAANCTTSDTSEQTFLLFDPDPAGLFFHFHLTGICEPGYS